MGKGLVAKRWVNIWTFLEFSKTPDIPLRIGTIIFGLISYLLVYFAVTIRKIRAEKSVSWPKCCFLGRTKYVLFHFINRSQGYSLRLCLKYVHLEHNVKCIPNESSDSNSLLMFLAMVLIVGVIISPVIWKQVPRLRY